MMSPDDFLTLETSSLEGDISIDEDLIILETSPFNEDIGLADEPTSLETSSPSQADILFLSF